LTIIDDRPAVAPDIQRGGLGASKPLDAAPDVHTLRIVDRTGDTPIHWTPGVAVETKAARKSFDKMKKAGYLAYKVDGEDRTQLHEFDETAGQVVMTPPLVGG